MELLRRCQDNLALVQKRADKLEASANSMVPKSELDLAQAATKKAFEKIAELEETVMTADSKALKLQEATEAAEAENTKAKSEISSLRKELSQFKSSFKMADTEALKLRKRAEQAEHDLRSLSVHHSSAWLPHWLEKSVVKYIADAHVVLSKGFSSANHTAYRASVASHAAWTQHVDPHVRQGVNFVKAKAVLAFAEGTKRLESAGVRLPTSMVTAKESHRRFFHAASTSDTTAQLLATLHSVGSWVHKQAHTVVTELEVLVVQTANKHPSLRLVAEKPLSMVAVYLILCEFWNNVGDSSDLR